ncbi:Vinorine synthase [Handroanthus impetiginosus]|uniref:Vinorine synthase n=1 Tax=Handroanthus impetiginosus TaxID=429701 RepID=A0A2G9GZV5_9LAMI|nr:Vinorine synthase [Handroanthus impetiginosus]
MSNRDMVINRFVFDKEKLSALKHGSTFKNPTRMELVSTFIWKHFIKMAKLNNPEATKMTFAAFLAVNLRTRISPPQFLENVLGNGIMSALAFSDDVKEYNELIRELRSSIRTVSDDYITYAQIGDSYLNDLFNMVSLLMKGELECCSFSSRCRFHIYEVDHGWGKPVALCITALPLKNFTILVDSKCGEGIEAWVNMNKDNLEMLEDQRKLILFHLWLLYIILIVSFAGKIISTCLFPLYKNEK